MCFVSLKICVWASEKACLFYAFQLITTPHHIVILLSIIQIPGTGISLANIYIYIYKYIYSGLY